MRLASHRSFSVFFIDLHSVCWTLTGDLDCWKNNVQVSKLNTIVGMNVDSFFFRCVTNRATWRSHNNFEYKKEATHLNLILNSINYQPTAKVSPVVLTVCSTMLYLWFFRSGKMSTPKPIHVYSITIYSECESHSSFIDSYGCFHFSHAI